MKVNGNWAGVSPRARVALRERAGDGQRACRWLGRSGSYESQRVSIIGGVRGGSAVVRAGADARDLSRGFRLPI